MNVAAVARTKARPHILPSMEFGINGSQTFIYNQEGSADRQRPRQGSRLSTAHNGGAVTNWRAGRAQKAVAPQLLIGMDGGILLQSSASI